MNNDLLMNDTLDNFVFTQEFLTLAKNSVDCHKNEKIDGSHISAFTSQTRDTEVSLDDSIFLEKALSVTLKKNKAEHVLEEIQNVSHNLNSENVSEISCKKRHRTRQILKSVHPIDKNTIVIHNKENKKELIVENDILLCKNISENIDNNSFNNISKVIDLDIHKLSSWGLPQAVLEKYEAKNLTSMFSWQVECLNKPEILINSKNLVYSAPTSAGKTLVAEILAIKTVFERQKKVIFILPFVSIVREKMYYFQDLLGTSGIRVEGFMGSYNPPGGFSSVHIAICTMEKANNLINRLLEDRKLSEIGAILVDEIHLLGDPSRGYLLELLLTKLQYITQKEENINIQIVGMSATLPNLNKLAKWLNAELFTTDFRPIPLHEQAIVCGEIYDNNLKLVRKLQPLPELGTDTDNILQLCLETIKDSCSTLIFCPTKNWCENLALQISSAFLKLGTTKTEWGEVLRSQLNTNLIMEVLEQLKYCPIGLDEVLRKTVSFGVAFHHAGLTMDERDIIEAAFRNGALRVLIATSTLSSGVNLPARRVIIRTPNFHGKPIDTLSYRQMIGRAGRMGKDSLGESYLICQKTDYRIAKELMSAQLTPVESCLEGTGKLKRAILEVIASGVASSPEDVDLFTKCTLLAIEDEDPEDLSNPIDEAVTFLKNNEFIRLQKQEDGVENYVPTSLGKACLSSSLAPDEGLALFTELEKARQCFVLETELHLIYLVTPYSACHSWGNIDWMFYLDMWEKLPASMKKVGELIGIRESYIVNATRGKILTNSNKLYHKLLVHKRFFVALALQDLVNEKPLGWVCAKFNCNRGMLQSLQQSASTFAGMVTSFSRQLGWTNVELLFSQFQDRLQFGVCRDLLDLMHLDLLNGKMARTLYNAGIETVAQLANSTVPEIENILHRVVPFETEKGREGESEFEKKQRNKYRNVWITGKEGLTEREAAEMMVSEARRYLKLEMGLVDAKWESSIVGDGLNFSKDSAIEEKELHINKNNIENVEEEENSKQNFEPNKTDLIMEIQAATDKSEEIVTNVSLDSSENIDISDTSSTHSSESTKIEDFEEANENDNSCNSAFKKMSNTQNKNSEKISLTTCSFSDINFTLIEESFEKQLKITDKKPIINKCTFNSIKNSTKNEISQILMSSPVELNVSDPSSPHTNINISLEKLQSDQSLFEESFTLHLSESDKEVSKGSLKKDQTPDDIPPDNFASPSFLENIFAETFDEGVKNSSNISDDVLFSSFEENLESSKKRKISVTGLKTSSKKLKRNRSNLEKGPLYENESYIENKFDSSESGDDFSKIEIVDVCAHNSLFDTFSKELKQQISWSLSIACSRIEEVKPVIGLNTKPVENTNDQNQDIYFSKNRKLNGFAISWGKNIVYYLPLSSSEYKVKIVNLIKSVIKNNGIKLRIFDAKEQIKVLKHCCDLNFYSDIEDPKVADWILNPEGKEKNLQAMAIEYCPETVKLSQLTGSCKGIGSVGLDLHSTVSPKTRSCVEAVVTWHLVESLRYALRESNPDYLKVFDVENRTMNCLARTELSGISVKMDLLQKLADDLKGLIVAIEKKAFSLAGRRFNFVSSADVAKVIGMFRGRKVSTRRQILEQNEHPISDLVLQWRKMNATLTKMIYPLIRVTKNQRIQGCYVTHTSTGRISMHEPNLQSITKDFAVTNPLTKENVNISCRSAFAVPEDYCLVSADYCQLELRILTHFSQDKVLCNIMRKPGDVFKSIAAKWNKVSEDDVTDSMRQNTKHLCYGIIYGMGSKALAEQLDIDENEATVFMETFRNTYPGIKKFIKETIEQCKKNEYVETITGRRRYLPHINENDIGKKGQAERQAVNTVVQGSAADITKKAMIQVESELQEVFFSTKNKPKLVLHLHDELIYEVQMKYVKKVARIIKKNMEESVKLSVPFPVKLKTGKSWGEMNDYAF